MRQFHLKRVLPVATLLVKAPVRVRGAKHVRRPCSEARLSKLPTYELSLANFGHTGRYRDNVEAMSMQQPAPST